MEDKPYDYDPDKAAKNLKKHGVSFDEGYDAYCDPYAVELARQYHPRTDGGIEERIPIIGRASSFLLLVICVETIISDRPRIVSTWIATRHDTAIYMAQFPNP